MWELFYWFGKHQEEIKEIVNDVNYKKRKRINELHENLAGFAEGHDVVPWLVWDHYTQLN